MFTKKLLALAVVGVFGLTACNQDKPAEKSADTQTASTEQKADTATGDITSRPPQASRLSLPIQTPLLSMT